ncbi:DUF3024 domain-containing protein [Pseudonocardia saturnea]
MRPSEEIRHALSEWCTARIPEAERGHRQIGYTVQGTEVTISDRRAPAHPRLDAEWTSAPLARLHLDPDGTGRWTLYRPAADGGWTRTSEGDDPIALLEAQAPA